MKIFRGNAEKYEKALIFIQKTVTKKVTGLLASLEVEDGKVLKSAKNEKALIGIGKKVEKIIDDAGFGELLKQFGKDVPKMLKKL